MWKGAVIRAAKVERPPKERSLVSALEASLPERRPGTKAAGRRQQRRAAQSDSAALAIRAAQACSTLTRR
jgi:hypothetical protein